MKKVLLLLILCTTCLYSQEFIFKKYTVNDGMLHNQVFDVIQASDGLLWTASVGGVSSFDGSNFTHYTKEQGLSSNLVNCLYEDSKQRVWMGTLDNGVSYFENDEIKQLEDPIFKSLGTITDFIEHPDGTLYIFSNRGLVSYNKGIVNVLSQIDRSVDPDTVFATNTILYDTNTFYSASVNDGVKKITLYPFSIKTINADTHGINNVCYGIYKDTNNTLWIGAYGALYRYKNDKITTFIPDQDNLDANRVYAIKNVSDTKLVIGTEGNGVLFFDLKNEQFSNLGTSVGFPSNYVYSLTQDYEDNLWFATFGEGIVMYRDASFSFLSKEAIGNSIINDVLFRDDVIYIATDNGLKIFKDKKIINTLWTTKKIHSLSSHQGGIIVCVEDATYSLDLTNKITLIEKGSFLTSLGYNNDIILSGDGKLVHITKDSTYYKDSRRAIEVLPLGNDYLITRIYGVFLLKNGEESILPGLEPEKHHGFLSGDVYDQNTVFLLSRDSLYQVKHQNGIYEKKTLPISALKSKEQFNAVFIKENTLWLAGRNVFLSLNISEWIENNNINTRTYKTISNDNQIDIHEDGLTSNIKGLLAASSTAGIVFLNPEEHLSTTSEIKLNLRQIDLFSEKVSDTLYKRNNSLALSYDKNYVTFYMQALGFTNSNDIVYKYRLKGLRSIDTWSLPVKNPKVVFPYLPSGDYTFEFMAAYNEENLLDENNQAYTFSLIIMTPFWKEPLFIWGISLLVFILLSSIFLNYFRIKAKRNATFSRKLLSIQDQEKRKLAREFHDSLGQKMVIISQQSKKLKNRNLQNLVNEAISEVRTIAQGLHPTILDELSLSKALEKLIDEVDYNTSILFSRDIQLLDKYIPNTASIHIYRIVQEALSNIVKHARAKSAHITLSKDEEKIILLIEDDGIGFNQSKNSFEVSLGLKTIQERCHIIGAQFHIKSALNQGTNIYILIPVIT